MLLFTCIFFHNIFFFASGHPPLSPGKTTFGAYSALASSTTRMLMHARSATVLAGLLSCRLWSPLPPSATRLVYLAKFDSPTRFNLTFNRFLSPQPRLHLYCMVSRLVSSLATFSKHTDTRMAIYPLDFNPIVPIRPREMYNSRFFARPGGFLHSRPSSATNTIIPIFRGIEMTSRQTHSCFFTPLYRRKISIKFCIKRWFAFWALLNFPRILWSNISKLHKISHNTSLVWK